METSPDTHSFRRRAHRSLEDSSGFPAFPSYTGSQDLTLGHQIRSKDHMDRIALASATRKLYRQLEKSIKVYENLLKAYDADVAKIRKYADERTMEQLWFLKVEGRPDRGGLVEDGFSGTMVKMMETGSLLVECLCDVRRSTLDEYTRGTPKEQRQVEKSRRLYKQVGFAGDQILDLLHLSVKSEDYCKELVSDMQRLKTLVDPKDKALSYDDTTVESSAPWYTTSTEDIPED
ncbi:hypothetical protein BP5796_03409 [Coleophoma crateriformis]|uniref:Uncharacterized protein n=1 Tax=Coleophoma crateriformis TaxID=565419 RepID=A0A3D8SN20_9HELO|nr:hypothetical protein BP5796_03409 [Coleophoma crateriformis]